LGVCYGASGPALVVHDGTAGLEANVVSNLSSKLTSAGYTVSTNVGVPAGSLATYKQVWDVRFNNTTPLSGSDISAYVTYMAGGGSLFVMGENTGFITRDNSIASLVVAAGGPTLTIVSPANAETVLAPFTGPNALSSITFLAAAGVPSAAPGQFITQDSSNRAAAIVFGPGNLSGAMAGSLIIVFDVNFLDLSADANSQTLTNNLIAYLAAPTPVGTPVSTIPFSAQGAPTLSEWGLMLLAAGLLLVATRSLMAAGKPRGIS
jgi:hypothetical protein